MSTEPTDSDLADDADSTFGSAWSGQVVNGKDTIIAVDAMGGDRGPAAVVGGVVRAARANPDVKFLLFGNQEELSHLVARPGLKGGLKGSLKDRSWRDRIEIRHASGVVTMETKPSHAMRHGKDTSMWAAIDAVKDGEASACVSCGNTGALMAVSMLRLRKLPGLRRPAIACLWPSRNPQGFNVILDVGADVSADAQDLYQFALMGSAYARNGLGLEVPRVGVLNVGTEDHKGRAEVREAVERIQAGAAAGKYAPVGFVEGRDLSSKRADVIVTDGFTGNVALKTGEGTASLISDFLKDSFKASFLSRIAALLAMTSLRRLSKRIDPRRVNGGVFLGLNGTVVKSHGGADSTGVMAAIDLAIRLSRSGYQERLAARVASASQEDQGAETSVNDQAGGQAAQ